MAEKKGLEAAIAHPLAAVGINAATAVIPPLMATAGLVGNAYAMSLMGIIPALHGILVSERHQKDVEETIESIKADVAALKIDFSNISTDQYNVANTAYLTIFSTLERQKLDALRYAVSNSLSNSLQSEGVGPALSRLIRDITAGELLLLRNLFRYNSVFISEKDSFQTPAGTYGARKGTEEEIGVTGLIRIGLLFAQSPTWDATQYAWSPLTAKLIYLTSPHP